ncbi:MAG: hypothetical protein R2848_06650 [Thermomicrobiales bacterium]
MASKSGRAKFPTRRLENEFTAVVRALEIARPGDVIAAMTHEHTAEICALFSRSSRKQHGTAE